MTISKTASGKAAFPYTIEKRLQIEYLLSATALSQNKQSDGSDVVWGLTQTPKTLPPRYFYDDRGSQLFEQICELPEYYPTRTEAAILQRFAAEIAQLTGACEIVELGSGSSTKTRILLDAYNKLGYPLRYVPIDVSAGILESSAKELLADYPSLVVRALVSTYELALERLEGSRLATRMICFLGSTLGNLNREECDLFLSQIANALNVGEYFLLGIDLEKSEYLLNAAYNDSQGVTAAFNLNMLEHLNWRFDGNFDPAQFEHWAFYNKSESQIEMHLRSVRSHTVQLRALDLTVEFEKGETIFTEISRKFDLNSIQKELQGHGLAPLQVWTDSNQWFGVLLCQMQKTKSVSVTA
ncbi:L-histidine N(alpha)-methyltransferase [Aerosakkonema sp. BLCC-F183]|uniref:L-histidine N(alpha)-methyltransferase n=1 Tax=Aerosakkonema sp. BLCC-F183 TaxID=3342834 RepID=UPI0035B7C2E1